MPRDRLPRIMKHYSPTGRRNRGRPLKSLLDTWDRNGSTSGLTPWQTYDDDDEHVNYTQVAGERSQHQNFVTAVTNIGVSYTGGGILSIAEDRPCNAWTEEAYETDLVTALRAAYTASCQVVKRLKSPAEQFVSHGEQLNHKESQMSLLVMKQ